MKADTLTFKVKGDTQAMDEAFSRMFNLAMRSPGLIERYKQEFQEEVSALVESSPSLTSDREMLFTMRPSEKLLAFLAREEEASGNS